MLLDPFTMMWCSVQCRLSPPCLSTCMADLLRKVSSFYSSESLRKAFKCFANSVWSASRNWAIPWPRIGRSSFMKGFSRLSWLLRLCLKGTLLMGSGSNSYFFTWGVIRSSTLRLMTDPKPLLSVPGDNGVLSSSSSMIELISLRPSMPYSIWKSISYSNGSYFMFFFANCNASSFSICLNVSSFSLIRSLNFFFAFSFLLWICSDAFLSSSRMVANAFKPS